MKQARRTKRLGLHGANAETGGEASSSADDAAPKKRSAGLAAPPAVARNLTKQQGVELLRAFWAELRQNNVRQVRKMLAANMRSVDFRAATFAPAADGSAMHLCAQHGLLAMARTLVELEAVDLDARNKVGSTALHVACKFGQEEMLRFLLELGARTDIPDNQNRIAFDVAPFAVVDHCILAPLRDLRSVEKAKNDELCTQHEAATVAVEEALCERCNTEMALAEAEGWASVERERLAAIRIVDSDWDNRVQRARDELERHRAVYREHLDILEDTRERIDAASGHLMAAVEQEKAQAQEELEQWTSHVQQVEGMLGEEQQDLDDQLGLLDAANAIPSDPLVQEWVLRVMTAMIEEDERCLQTDSNGTRSSRLLARDEVVDVILNALVRFSTTRHVQRCALQCLSALLSHVIAVLAVHDASNDEMRSLQLFLGEFVAAKSRKNSVLTLCRDVLTRYGADVEMNALVAAVLYRVLRLRSTGSAPLMPIRFSHEKRNQRLPLDMLQLYERSRRLDPGSWTEKEWMVAVRDAAFLLFTVTKASAVKVLLANGVVATAVFWLEELAAMDPGAVALDKRLHDEAQSAATQFLLGALSFLHLAPWFPTANATVVMAMGGCGFDANSRSLEDIHPWCGKDIRSLLTVVSPTLRALGTHQSDVHVDVDARGFQYRMLVCFWTLKLLRNLTMHHGEAARAVRIKLFAPEVFSLLSGSASALLELSVKLNRPRELLDAVDVPSLGAVVGVWMDLAESVWIRHYDGNGKLRATVDFMAEHALSLVSWLTKRLGCLGGSDATLSACSRALSALELVLSNDKNARYMGTHTAALDEAICAFLRWMLTLRAAVAIAGGSTNLVVSDEDEDCGVTSAVVFEALAHVLRIYLSSLSDQLGCCDKGDEVAGRLAVQKLHDRCRAVGICAVLRAFHVLDDAREEASERQEDCEASSPRLGGHLESLRRLRAADKSKATGSASRPRDHSAQDECRVLRALSRAVVDLVHCMC